VAKAGESTVSGVKPEVRLFKEKVQRTAARADAASQEVLRAELLNLSREAILILNQEGKIVFWSRGAERLYGWSVKDALGKVPFELLKTESPRSIAQIENILRSEPYWDGEVKQTTRQGTRVTVASRRALWRDERGNPQGQLQLDTDITQRKQIEQELRVLSGRLLTLRDEERRRLARNLHDSVGQMLTGAGMNLSIIQQLLGNDNTECQRLLRDLAKMLDDSVKEIRTLSYLLHPPLLDEVGLYSALHWYVSGFSERSGIDIELHVPEDLGRFRDELELALFRIVQETLTNVHRHSGSSKARITVSKSPRQVRLKVEDFGKGMPLPLAERDRSGRPIAGVGLSGIRERVRQLAGQIQIRSSSAGTAIEVLFPLDVATASLSSSKAAAEFSF